MGRDSQSVREEVRSAHIKVRKVKPGRVAGLHAFIGQLAGIFSSEQGISRERSGIEMGPFEPGRGSANAYPQMSFLLQPIDLHPREIAARDDPPNPSVLDDR